MEKYINDIIEFRDTNIVSDRLYVETCKYITDRLYTDFDYDTSFTEDIISQTWLLLTKAIGRFTFKSDWKEIVRLTLVRAMWRYYKGITRHVKIPSNYMGVEKKYNVTCSNNCNHGETMDVLATVKFFPDKTIKRETLESIIKMDQSEVVLCGTSVNVEPIDNIATSAYKSLLQQEIRTLIMNNCIHTNKIRSFEPSQTADLKIICLELYIFPLIFGTGAQTFLEMATVMGRSISRVGQLLRRIVRDIKENTTVVECIEEYISIK